MLKRKKRFFLLASLMVLLVGLVSVFSSRYLYETSLREQKIRLYELVESQASLASELAWVALHLETDLKVTTARDLLLQHLSRAYKNSLVEGSTCEFSIAKRTGDNVEFLVVNGEIVQEGAEIKYISFDSPYAEPMKKALNGESGTIVGLDSSGVEVLAAYTPLSLQFGVLGMVAKNDLEAIRAPFIQANLIVFGVGLVLTSIFLFVFFRLSEPIFKDIQQSEKQYRDVVEGARNLILRVLANGTISFANSYANTLLLHEKGSLVGQDLSQFIVKDVSVKAEDILTRMVESQKFQYETEICLPDGTHKWISWVARVISDEGQPTELLCIGNESTSEHLANDARREVEERFRGIAKASPVGIIITNMEGHLLYANEQMHQLTGLNSSELIGQGWLQRIHEEERTQLLERWFSSTPVHKGRRELRLLSSEGKTAWVLGQIVELKNSTDVVVGNVVTFTDITQIKEAELAKSRLSAAIEQASEMIIIMDMDANITYVNPAFEKTTGYKRDTVIGKSPGFLNSGEQDSSIYEELWRTVTRGDVYSGRFINLKKNGKRYTQELSIGPILDGHGDIIGYVGVARDISEQLVIEAQLRQSQKLESIGELAAGIAHEINTPTQYVSSNIQFLKDSFITYEKMLEQCRELVERVMLQDDGPSCVSLREFAENLLDEKELEYLKGDIPQALNESEAGLKRVAEIVRSVKQLAHPGEMNKSYHQLNEIVRDAVTVSANEWKYVAEVVSEYDDTLHPVFCLKGEVGQVVLNLIINGAHAIEKKKLTTGEQGVISVKTYQAGAMAVLEVADTGTGIPSDVIDKIFDPFFTTKEVGKGTGQGLAIAHNVVVNMHGGKIDVSTEPGEGTTFVVRLPFESEHV
ncbi:PAS domain S-box protein [uncultured Pseudodesulfovibrio sp.]|uniref:PAS domain-containing sensor histidine kinase n=1 Tax=uncultured Pseudodesulfovibrio sp. TaxID=2035858 RepID=UPI0029C894BD|nr:PAS domain S-box protein [uncultured Pseudodesulfovibrio sp.]